MSGFLHQLAGAALPVAIGLLVCAAAARAVLVSTIDDERVRRIAAGHLDALCVWALLADGLFVLARLAAGEGTPRSLLLAVALAAGALWLPRLTAETGTDPAPGTPTAQGAHEVEPNVERDADPTPARPFDPVPATTLWATPSPDADRRSNGALWRT